MSDRVLMLIVEFQFSHVRISLCISILNKRKIGVHLIVFEDNTLSNELWGIPQEETIERISHGLM